MQSQSAEVQKSVATTAPAHAVTSTNVSDMKQTALTFVKASPSQFRPDFLEWLDKNYDVWLAFRREADRVWARGRTHYSARTIGEYLRHETALAEAPNRLQLKLNDHYWPDLARLYLCYHPDRPRFFERRSGQSAVRAA